MMRATSTGSLPGQDMPGAVRAVLGGFELAWLPELPARGVGADMIGRSTAMLEGLGVDLQPAGWRLTDHGGVDHARAISLLRKDLDELEEHAQAFAGTITITAAGPWTLAASMEKPRGDKVLADHGARRELAESLAGGLANLLSEMKRRLPRITVAVQLDEPLLPLVLSGGIATASGFSRMRSVHPPQASELLGLVAAACHREVSSVRLHCCAPGIDVDLLRRSGIDALSLDARLLTGKDWDQLGPWLEDGRQLVLGLVRTDIADELQRPDQIVRAGLDMLRPLGLDPALVDEHLVIGTACGLAGWSTRAASAQLDALLGAAPLFAEQLAR